MVNIWDAFVVNINCLEKKSPFKGKNGIYRLIHIEAYKSLNAFKNPLPGKDYPVNYYGTWQVLRSKSQKD